MSRRAPRNGGFLLAEMLVTMAISAFLLVALGSLLHVVLRADARAAALAAEVESSSRAVDALGRDLRGAARVRWAGGAGTPFVFAGEPQRMRLALLDPATNRMRLVWLEGRDGRVNTLRRADAPLPSGAVGPSDIAPAGEGVLVYGGRLAVRFGYFSPFRAGREILTDTWTEPLAMPAAVRIAWVEPTSGAIVRSVRIALMSDAETGCAAPSMARCSYVETGEADAIGEADLPRESVDAADPLGWLRYAR